MGIMMREMRAYDLFGRIDAGKEHIRVVVQNLEQS